MPTKTLNLYHVTPLKNAIKILDSHGIDPKLSQGRNQWCWYVTKRQITWAIAHVIHRHTIDISEIAILWVKAPYTEVWKTNKTGVYATHEIFYPLTMESAEIWLSREQKYLVVKGRGTRGHRFKDYGDYSAD